MANKIKNIISLFDGVSCAQVAIKDLGYEVNYYASEIDPYAIEITKHNHPNTTHIGDIQKVSAVQTSQDFKKYIFYGDGHQPAIPFTEIDLLIGGSPCQDLSIAKKNREGLAGKRSGLFYEYVRLLKEIKPKYFILENVASMPKEAQEEISKELGVQPVMINAALVSAQNRKRLFWVGKLETDGTYNQVLISQPKDRNIFLKDILLDGTTEDLKSLCITATYHKKNERDFLKKASGQMIRIGDIGTNAQAHRVYSPEGKSVALSALGGGQGAKTGLYLTPKNSSFDYYNNKVIPNEKAKTLGTNPQSITAVAGQVLNDGNMLRKLHPKECERLQGLPDNYTLGNGTSNTQRYKMLGNAFNVEVIKHIIKTIWN